MLTSEVVVTIPLMDNICPAIDQFNSFIKGVVLTQEYYITVHFKKLSFSFKII